jgi:hypothetical protein
MSSVTPRAAGGARARGNGRRVFGVETNFTAAFSAP